MSGSASSQLPESNAPLADFGLGPDPLSDKIAFPQLSEVELSEVAFFGERRSFAKDEPFFCAGDYPFNSHAILSGTVPEWKASSTSPVSICADPTARSRENSRPAFSSL
jgi:hypothetical protein